jgi:hypothetical protein
MLKVVTPAIKAEDPQAKVWIGGLLLDRPDSLTYPPNCYPLTYCGRSELFLQGILEAQAASYFDIVPYHSYSSYKNQVIDYDNGDQTSLWYPSPWGGNILGKGRYLRQWLDQYGVQKPLFVDEVGLMCPEYYPNWCSPPNGTFYQAQANYVVRSLVRGLSENITGYTWFMLNGPGWRYSGLLYNENDPKPAYTAYQQLIHQLQYTKYVGSVYYNTGIEAYAFQRGDQQVHVIWTATDQSLIITIPSSRFVSAFAWDGTNIVPIPKGSDYGIPVGFSPIYLVLKP